ncbi:MAG: porin family protein [bacterium]
MKKKLYALSTFVLILFLLPVYNLSAQDFHFGIKGGLNISAVKSDEKDPLTKTGFNIYTFVDFPSEGIVGFTIESGYTQKGYQYYRFTYDTASYEINGKEKISSRIDYLDLSLLMKIKASKAKIVPYVLLGPSFGLRLATKVKSNSDQFLYLHASLNSLQIFSFGAKAGIGAEYLISNDLKVLLEGRANFDLTNSFVGNSNLGWEYRGTFTNTVFEFTAGVKF